MPAMPTYGKNIYQILNFNFPRGKQFMKLCWSSSLALVGKFLFFSSIIMKLERTFFYNFVLATILLLIFNIDLLYYIFLLTFIIQWLGITNEIMGKTSLYLSMLVLFWIINKKAINRRWTNNVYELLRWLLLA